MATRSGYKAVRCPISHFGLQAVLTSTLYVPLRRPLAKADSEASQKQIEHLLLLKNFWDCFFCVQRPKGGLGGGSQGLEQHLGQGLKPVHLCWHTGDSTREIKMTDLSKQDASKVWIMKDFTESVALDWGQSLRSVNIRWVILPEMETNNKDPFLWWTARCIWTNHMPKCNWTASFEQQSRAVPPQWKRLSTYLAELHVSTVWTQNIQSSDRGKSGKHLFLQG